MTTQRPDLFAAAVAEVPAADVLRFDFGRHRAQIGDARDPAQFPFLLAGALQSAQGCPWPVVLRVHDAGGHLGNRGPDAWIEDQAEAMAFVARRLGMAP